MAEHTTNSPSTMGLYTEPEGALNSPQPILETMGMPDLPLANRTSLALAKQRSILDKMCTNIITCTNKLKQYNTNNLIAQQRIIDHKCWQSIRTMFQHYTVDSHLLPLPNEETPTTQITNSLIQCVDKHYCACKSIQYTLIKNHIQNTYLTLKTINSVTNTEVDTANIILGASYSFKILISTKKEMKIK